MSTTSDKSFNIKDSFKYLLILLSIFLISLLLPGDRNIDEEIIVGARWTQDDLITDSDYKLQKTDAEIKNFEKEISPSYKTLLKYQEADVHELGSQLFKTSENLLSNGIQVKSLMTLVYAKPIRQDLTIEGKYFVMKEDIMQPFTIESTQTLEEQMMFLLLSKEVRSLRRMTLSLLIKNTSLRIT